MTTVRGNSKKTLGLLQAYASATSAEPSNTANSEEEVSVICDQIVSTTRKENASKPTIPTFYKPKPNPNSLRHRLRQEAKQRCRQQRAETVLDDLSQLRNLIDAVVSENAERRLNYDLFSLVATKARELGYGTACDVFFKSSTFLRMYQDGNGCINPDLFMRYIELRSNMQRLHWELSTCDEQGLGTLTQYQLEEFMRERIPYLAGIENMPSSFVSYYKQIAVRKFMFFHAKNGIVRIRDLLNSHVMHELMELNTPGMLESELLSNWFSFQSTRRVQGTFLALDEDMNNLLSRQEFSQISNGTMSPLFISRVFEEHVMKQKPLTRGGQRDEMDLVAFTDFVLAWDNRHQPAAIKYFFPIFDLQKKGLIHPVDIYTFFKDIHAMWVDMGEYSDLSVYDVIDELLDMVKPADPPAISQEDLSACNMAGTFFQILADVKQFYDYNYRENQMQHNEDDQ